MRKIVTMVALSVALMVASAGAVFATNAVIRCASTPCYSTGNQDLVYERVGNRINDKIYLRGGSDQVRADRYTGDRDLIYGGKGYDLIYVNDGDRNDRIRGGQGNDKCYVDARSEIVSGCSNVVVR